MNPEIIALCEHTLIVRLGIELSAEINDRVLALAESLQSHPIAGVLEWTPSCSELLVIYNPLSISFQSLSRTLSKRMKRNATPQSEQRLQEIPVCYCEEFAPDLSLAAEHCGMNEAELIRRHCAPIYRVYMLGFSPGFCYLGGLDPCLAIPRLKEPRLNVPAGSVGIAEAQTGIYSLESPGGWSLIGRCPLSLFSPDKEPFFRIKAGDRIRFFPINVKEFQAFQSGDIP